MAQQNETSNSTEGTMINPLILTKFNESTELPFLCKFILYFFGFALVGYFSYYVSHHYDNLIKYNISINYIDSLKSDTPITSVKYFPEIGGEKVKTDDFSNVKNAIINSPYNNSIVLVGDNFYLKRYKQINFTDLGKMILLGFGLFTIYIIIFYFVKTNRINSSLNYIKPIKVCQDKTPKKGIVSFILRCICDAYDTRNNSENNMVGTSLLKIYTDLTINVLFYNLKGIFLTGVTILTTILAGAYITKLFDNSVNDVIRNGTSITVMSSIILILRTSLLSTFIMAIIYLLFRFTKSTFDQVVRFTKRKHSLLFLLELLVQNKKFDKDNLPNIMMAFNEWNKNVSSAYSDKLDNNTELFDISKVMPTMNFNNITPNRN